MSTAAVFELAEEFWVVGAPSIHSCIGDVASGLGVVRFEVIAHGDEHVEWFVINETFPGSAMSRNLRQDFFIVRRGFQSFCTQFWRSKQSSLRTSSERNIWTDGCPRTSSECPAARG